MTQQINLYDPALLRKRELLAATNVAAVAVALLLAMTGWSFSARSQLAALQVESQAVTPQVKTLQEQMTELARQMSTLKPDARIEAELTAARALLSLRGEVLDALQKGIGGGTTGFGEYLRALARQSVSGLWLTGFSVTEGGAGMEIRGRMSDPSLLPDYIRKLNAEKAFQGRSFAALKVSAGQTSPAAGTPAAAPAPAAAAPQAPYHEFVLAPETAGRAEAGRPTAEGRP